MTASWTRHVQAVLIIVGILALAYWKVGAGANFFAHEDFVGISNYSYGNSLGNGWRPDKGLGISAFFGDAMAHPWSLFSLWEHAIHSRAAAYTSSVIFLAVMAALAQYVLLLRVMPQCQPLILALTAPLIVLGMDQMGYYFLRVNASLAAASPLFLIVLYDFYKSPRWIHFFYTALLFWFAAMFGDLWNLTQLMALGAAFTVLYGVYHKAADRLASKFLCLYAFGAAVFILLSFWILYPFILEKITIDYVREKDLSLQAIQWIPQLKGLGNFLVGYLTLQGLPAVHDLVGLNFVLYRFSCSVIFPLIFAAFMFRRSSNFWEFALKWLVGIILIHWFLIATNLAPGYGPLYAYVSNKTSKILTLYEFFFPMEVPLLVMFALEGRNWAATLSSWARRLQVVLAVVISGFYSVMTILAATAVFLPGLFSAICEGVVRHLPAHAGGYSREVLELVVTYNAARFEETMHWHSVMFFLMSAVLAGVFLKKSWLIRALNLPRLWIAGILVVHALCLSWSMYPLNTKPLAWDNPGVKALSFKPTDRFYFLRNDQWEKTPEGFHQRWIEGTQGYRQHQIGLLEPPGLTISGLKSFASKAEGRFMMNVFNGDGIKRIDFLRLYYGGPVFTSPWLDLAAVNYYYADSPVLGLPDQLEPYAQLDQLFIYKNAKAWPYYYLADHIEPLTSGLKQPVPGTAYVDPGLPSMPAVGGQGHITLKKFSYGRMDFEFKSRHDEFLVVADAWHPFWKAKAEGRGIKIVRTNEIFKGVELPAGEYDLSLYFDASPYRKGIWITIVAWLVFLPGLAIARRHQGTIRYLEGA